MFGVEIVMAELAAAQHEREVFEKVLASLPEADQPAYRKSYYEAKEKRYQEIVAERRHQELCEAIRDSRPRGIGLFL